MATKPLEIPPTEFKQPFEAATAEEAFAAIEDKRESEGYLVMVPIDAIHPLSNFNIRVHTPDYEAHIERIAQSIKDSGFFRHFPLKVFPATENGQNLLYLVGGYSRFEAAKRAVAAGVKLSRLPVVATPKGTTLDDLLIGIDRDNDGRPLSPFERGILIKRLVANENDEDEIANALGVTKKYVADLLLLMAAPKALHNMVVNGEVAANLAIELIKEHGSGKKAVEALKAAGATGERTPPAANGEDKGEGEGDGITPAPAARVTRAAVARTGGTARAGKKLYEALIEYLIVLNGTAGAQSAMDFLLKWQEKDPEAVKELAKLAKPAKKAKKAAKKPPKEKNPKDVRVKITDTMSDEEKATARAHNKEVKKRKERREKRAAAKAAEAAGTAPPPSDDDPI